ncbi:MAG: glycoside hydrolase family 3 C-terminal domain-containing protein [Spirochaetaceae bacterium]|nr:glycoside hydrolase family 3 C-terminal domain-containing protein [Spirochaetaceae bacterium]
MNDFSEKAREILARMSLEEKAGLCSGLDFWHTKPVERLGVPSVMLTDGPHGLRKQDGQSDHLRIGVSVPAVCFPTASALASSFDRELLYRVGETLGNECQAEDVAILLGPGANIKRSPLCGRNFEYFSEDPYLSGELAAAHIQGLQSQGIGASLKHFAANNQETRRMTCSSNVEERALHEIYLASFEGAVKGGKPKTVMCSYNKINGTFAAENRELLTDVLRDRWGFEGFVVTDWGAVKDRVKGLLAGLDLEMPGSGGVNDKRIVEAVKSGGLKEEILDISVLRILQLVLDYVENRRPDAVFDRDRDHRIAVEAAAGCAVLLKNEGNLLPLKKETKVAVIGEFAEKPRFQGSGSSFINAAKISSAIDALAGNSRITYARGYDANSAALNETLINEAVEAAGAAEAAVLFVGLPNSFESEGFDRRHIDLPENQNALIRAVCKVQKNTVLVLHNGAPVAMPWIDGVPSVLEMYLGGEGVGEATVSLLYGETNPSGKLAETFPVKLGDNPSYLSFPGYKDESVYREGVYVGYRYYDKKGMPVLFPFGHGLSYTGFEYSELKINKTSINDTETCTVTLRVKNTGSRAGKEVVQLYVGNHEDRAGGAGIDRPVRELKGFTKVSLEPGAEKIVSFTLDKRAFAYYDARIHDWFVESGKFKIDLGSSSRDIRLSEVITVEGTKEIPIVFTRHSTFEDIMATAKGQAILGEMMAQMRQLQSLGASLGDGANEMLEAAAKEMPLEAMLSFGSLSEEQLAGILAALNG